MSISVRHFFILLIEAAIDALQVIELINGPFQD